MDKIFTQAVRKLIEDRIPDRDIKKGEKLAGKAEIRKLEPDMVDAVFPERYGDTKSIISFKNGQLETHCVCSRFRESNSCQHIAALADLILSQKIEGISASSRKEKTAKVPSSSKYSKDPKMILKVLKILDPELDEKMRKLLAKPDTLSETIKEFATGIARISSTDDYGEDKLFELDEEAAGFIKLFQLFTEIDEKIFLKEILRFIKNFLRLKNRKKFPGFCSISYSLRALRDILPSLSKTSRNKLVIEVIKSELEDHEVMSVIKDIPDIFDESELAEFAFILKDHNREYGLSRVALASKDPDLILNMTSFFSPSEIEKAVEILISKGMEKEGRKLLNDKLEFYLKREPKSLYKEDIDFIGRHAPDQMLFLGKRLVQSTRNLSLAVEIAYRMPAADAEVFKKWAKEYLRQEGDAGSILDIAYMDKDPELLRTVSMDTIIFSLRSTRSVTVNFLEIDPSFVANILYAYAIENCDRNPQRKIYAKVARLLRDILDLAERKGLEKPILDMVEKLKRHYARRPSLQEQFRKENL